MALIVNSTIHSKNTNSLQTPPQKIGEKEIFPNSFCEATIPLIPNQTKTLQDNYRAVSWMNTDSKIHNKILVNQIQQHVL